MTETSTRERLIEVGIRLMHKHGYTATGLKEILDLAGVPKGSFYHHFGSKEEFAAAALNRYFMREGEHCDAVLNDSRIAPLKRLHRYFNDLIKMYGQKGDIPGCMIGRFSLEVPELTLMMQEHLSASFKGWQHGIATALRDAIKQKSLPANTDPEELAAFLLNSWQGALVRSQADKSDAPLHNFIHYAFSSLLKDSSR
jgi:TetR/AcrR family transcriptional regulator, transcriptional repressor for nem operon